MHSADPINAGGTRALANDGHDCHGPEHRYGKAPASVRLPRGGAPGGLARADRSGGDHPENHLCESER
jgi:hypothetical protein